MKTFTPVVLLMLGSVCSCTGDTTGNDEPPQVADIRTLDQLSLAQSRVFLRGHSGDWRKDTDYSRGIPAPPIQKPYPEESQLVDLVRPENITIGDMPLARAIKQRRSRREYTDDPLSNEELSFLLWCTQGVSKLVRDENGKIAHHFRTVPSGGARHPFETYLVVNRVDGLTSGIYRFLAVEHKLLLIREDRGLPQNIRDACYGQEHAGQAAVVLVWTAIPYRTEWRYGHIAHRIIAMDAGHVCQNLYLAVESIGGGACAILGYDQARLDKLIDVDGKDEFTIYLATVGKVPAK